MRDSNGEKSPLTIEFNDEKLILEKIVFSFGRSMRHLSSLAWGEVDFILWPARFATFRQAATNGTIRILSFQIQQTDQTQMPGFEQLFDIIGTDLKWVFSFNSEGFFPPV